MENTPENQKIPSFFDLHELLDARQAAEYLNVSYYHLANMRYKGYGPKYHKTKDGRIYYKLSELNNHLGLNLESE